MDVERESNSRRYRITKTPVPTMTNSISEVSKQLLHVQCYGEMPGDGGQKAVDTATIERCSDKSKLSMRYPTPRSRVQPTIGPGPGRLLFVDLLLI